MRGRKSIIRREIADLRCQIGTSNVGRGGRRYQPYVFTEQGLPSQSPYRVFHREIVSARLRGKILHSAGLG